MSTILAWQDHHQSEDSSPSLCCPRCESSLTLHQPDAELPNRLLATCEECKSWYLTDPDGTDLIPIPGSTKHPFYD